MRLKVGGVPIGEIVSLIFARTATMRSVLADGTSTYLYANGRLAQYQTAMQYFGADGLGSVRQIYDASAQVVGSTRYDPFGGNMGQSGTATSVFAFAGEQQDATGLTYLRARYYSAAQGRFTTRDVWEGDDQRPLTLNRWNYTHGNPINLTDPSGMDPPWCQWLPSAWGCAPSPTLTPWTPTLPPGMPTLPPTPTFTCTPTQTPTSTPTLGPRPTATREDMRKVAIIATFEGQVFPEDFFHTEVYKAIAWTIRNRVATGYLGATGYSDEIHLLNYYNAWIYHKNDPPRMEAVIAAEEVLFMETTAADPTHRSRHFVDISYWTTRGYNVDQVQKLVDSGAFALYYPYRTDTRFFGIYFFDYWPPALPPVTPTPTPKR